MTRYLIALNCLIISTGAIDSARVCTFTNTSNHEFIIETYKPGRRCFLPKTVQFTVPAHSAITREIYPEYPINSFYPARLGCLHFTLFGSTLKKKQIPASGQIAILEKGEFMVAGQIIKRESR